MSYRSVHDVAVRLMRGEVIEVTDWRGRHWTATREALVCGDGTRLEDGAYDVAVTLVWWAATERIPSLWPSVSKVA